VSWMHGTFFAVVAWLQISWGVAFLVSPTRKLLAAAAIGNTVVIATWLMSRLWGVPVGPDPWTTEPVALVDALATGFEVAIVLVSLGVLLRPAVAQRTVRPAVGLAGIGVTGLAIAVVSTMALSPAFASEHAHGGSEDDDHAEAAAAGDHDHASGEAAAGGEGNSGHGHRGPVPWTPLDETTRTTLAGQVAQANAVTLAYPTVAAAEAGGYRRITPYVPCIAAHYLNSGILDGTFDPAHPEILLFDGTDPDSQIVGLSYLAFTGPDTPPEGFAGGNDPWHVHRQLCLGGGGVLGDENATEEDCTSRGGRVVPLEGLWMSHMWNVAGWDSRWGLFSSEHPDLGGRIGDINAAPEGDG